MTLRTKEAVLSTLILTVGICFCQTAWANECFDKKLDKWREGKEECGTLCSPCNKFISKETPESLQSKINDQSNHQNLPTAEIIATNDWTKDSKQYKVILTKQDGSKKEIYNSESDKNFFKIVNINKRQEYKDKCDQYMKIAKEECALFYVGETSCQVKSEERQIKEWSKAQAYCTRALLEDK